MTKNKVVDVAEMVQDAETKTCGFCGKEIPVAKIRIHDVMCSRINYICKKCGMCVVKAEREQHDEEVCGQPVADQSKQVNVSSDDDAGNPAVNSSATTGASSHGTDRSKSGRRNNEEEKDDNVAEAGSNLTGDCNAAMADDDEATQREIQRLLQEDMNMMDANKI